MPPRSRKRRSTRRGRLGGLLPLALLALIGLAALLQLHKTEPPERRRNSHAPAESQGLRRCLRVIDGDSMVFETQQSFPLEVRLVGINAPEGDTAEGQRAAALAGELIRSASRMRYELEPSGSVRGSGLDKHGRSLAWVWLTHPSEDVGEAELLLNAELIRRGAADMFRHAGPEMRHYSLLLQAGEERDRRSR